MLRATLAALLFATLLDVPAHAQRTTTAASRDSVRRAMQAQAAASIELRAELMRDTKPCTPPPLVDTTNWQEARLPDGSGANATLPPGFAFDSTPKFFHGGVQWRRGKQVFARMRGWWGPSTSACRISLGGMPYVLESRKDTAGVSLFAFPADTAWGESEAIYAASPDAGDLDVLWTVLQLATPVCDRLLLGKSVVAFSPNNPCPGKSRAHN